MTIGDDSFRAVSVRSPMKDAQHPSKEIVIALPLKGGVRQVHCPAVPSAVVGLCLLFFAGISGWALIDYTRLVTLTVHHQESIGELTERNEALTKSTNALRANLARISHRVRLAAVRRRDESDELRETVLAKEPSSGAGDEWEIWGDIGPWWLAGRSKNRRAAGGIGGAEVDCGSARGRCGSKARKAALVAKQVHATVEDTAFHAVPLAIPVSGPVTSHFGVRTSPFTHGRRMHEGMDIDCRVGAPIQASGAGIVEFVGRHGTYGLVVDINHGGGLVTRYAHLSAATQRVGTRVGRGTLIGRCGTSGRSTGPHLHYEIRENGNPVDPRRYLFIGKTIDATPVRGVQVAAKGRGKGWRKIG